MTSGVKGSGPDGGLTPAEIAERDLFWLVEEAGEAISKQLASDERRVPALLRGIARTASKTALHYERAMGQPRGTKAGRPRAKTDR